MPASINTLDLINELPSKAGNEIIYRDFDFGLGPLPENKFLLSPSRNGFFSTIGSL
jgi:hypothetical protein